MHRVAAGALCVAALALIGAATYWFAEYLGAGDDPWARLAIVPAIVAFISGILIGMAAIFVWRDTVSGWIGAAVVTVITAIGWIDFGMGSPGMELPFLLLPSLIVGAIVALTIARLARGRWPAERR